MTFELSPLPYAADALSPFMSAQTLGFHHGKHHQAYVTNLNNLIKDTPLATQSLETIIRDSYNKDDKAGIFNNASQIWNHNHFWRMMKPKGGGAVPSNLEKALIAQFKSLDGFKQEFTTAATSQFGSGWAWLVLQNGQLKVTKTPNGVNPLCFNQTAILGIDVWEHSYYLDYQNRRADYVKAFLDSLVNWEYATELFETAQRQAA